MEDIITEGVNKNGKEKAIQLKLIQWRWDRGKIRRVGGFRRGSYVVGNRYISYPVGENEVLKPQASNLTRLDKGKG